MCKALRVCAVAAFWLWVVFIVLATLSPIAWRPETGHVHLERIAAYGVLGVLWVCAYPARWRWGLVAVALGAFGLEITQSFNPERHGRLLDAIEKAVGGILGVGLGAMMSMVISRVRGLAMWV